jgi:phenylpropionate dioxygenase-like ring-hydroxylating dioxygenase large terminal subunit
MKPEDYTQGDAFQAEKRGLFSRQWLPLCAEAQLASPGQFVSASVGGWSVFGVRGQDGTVRVLRNACRHQNMPVVGTPSGSCETFRCRFHGWTYGLDGRFLSAPPPVAPASTADLDLQQLATAFDSGMVFFTVEEGDARPALGVAGSYVSTATADVACNWKIAVEEVMLARPDLVWHGPLLATEGALVLQVVPHTFLRTRLNAHAFGQAGELPFAALKEKCEARQAEGALPAASPQVAEFHRRYGSS